MNKFYLSLLFSLLTATSFSQIDSAAYKILNAVSSKMKKSTGVSAGFTMVSKGRTGNLNSNNTGKILIKGNKYYIKQGSNEIFNDGIKNWNYNGNDEVTVTDAESEDQPLSPQRLISGEYDKDFVYKIISSKGSYHEIQLIPFDKRKNFQKINLFVDKVKMIISKATVLDKSNNTFQLLLNNINTKANLTEKAFVFDKTRYHKNIEVIE